MPVSEEIKSQTPEDFVYGPHWYRLDLATLNELKTLKPYKPVLAAFGAWILIFLIVKIYLFLSSPSRFFLYPLAAFLIAGRAGVFLQLAHEAAHRLVSKGRFNDWFGRWVAANPLGLDFKGYKDPHLRHHACTNEVCDPLSDSEKYRICDIRNPKLALLFLKDLLGITAITIKLMYDQPLSNKNKQDIQDYLETQEGRPSYQPSNEVSRLHWVKSYVSIVLVQLAILGFLFNFNFVHYVFLWFVPLLSAHMFFMRVRGIAEHGLGIQLGVKNLEEKTMGFFYIRSFGTSVNHYSFPFLTWLERFLIGSLNVYYHHEHHLYPQIPYYNLPKIHKLISEKIKANNPHVYAKGYFDCLFFNLRLRSFLPT